MINIDQNNLSYNNLSFIYIYKNLFYFYITKSLSHFNFTLLGIINLVFYIKLYFDIEYNKL